ncbi:MAG TPA: choice-of-anchor V domain-containing protein [Candidatus Solibacter sp.]
MAPAKHVRKGQLAALTIAVPVLMLAFTSGPDAGVSGVPGEESCSGCHNGPPGQGNVTITFPGGASYAPGVKQHLVVTIADSAQRRWGFQLTARLANSPATQAGSFTTGADGYTQLVCTQANFHSQAFGNGCATNGMPLQYVEHTQSGTRLGAKSPVTFEFDWTPPASNAGNLVLYVAAVAANGDNSARGDHVYVAKYTVAAPGTQPPPPVISAVVNGASFQQAVSAGSWVSILGTNLAGTTRPWTSADFAGSALPTQLDGVGVKINGRAAYVAYISPSQINVQAPADSAVGPVAVEINNSGTTGAASSAQLQAASPAFFLWNGKYAVATRLDFSLVGPPGLFPGAPTVPAKPGDAIILWGTGFGATDPAVAPGTLPPANQVCSVVSPVSVTIGNIDATVIGAALTPGNAGLYQIAVQVPASVPDGDQTLIAQVAGMQSPSNVLLNVKR